ncbi:MAG: nucleotidyltransferase domain-containing protein [Candidatus Omnitrophota bacterium]
MAKDTGNSYMYEIKEAVLSFLKGEDVKVVLFGSRARGDNDISSDLDIGIIPKGSFDKGMITLLKEKIFNLNTPYKVEIVNLSEAGDIFKEQVLKEAVVWKD